jgi:hypothetical protein
MNNLNLTLSSLIVSRICHDLISPIGAINNGLELVELNGAQVSPEMSLIEQSCAAATARIQFFRLAYSKALDGQIISNRETVQIINRAIQSERLVSCGTRKTICRAAKSNWRFGFCNVSKPPCPMAGQFMLVAGPTFGAYPAVLTGLMLTWGYGDILSGLHRGPRLHLHMFNSLFCRNAPPKLAAIYKWNRRSKCCE